MRLREVLFAAVLAPLVSLAQVPCPPTLTSITGSSVSSTPVECQPAFTDLWPTQGPIATVSALRNRRGFSINTNRHAFTGLSAGQAATIYRVTTSAQLKTALEASGNRIIVFERSGTYSPGGIGSTVVIENGNLWIAGQTAPSPGVTIRGVRLQIRAAKNVLIQHVRLHLTEAWGSGANVGDTLFVGGREEIADDLVFDHVDFAFSFDELVDLTAYSSIDMDFVESAFIYPLECAALSGGAGASYGPRMDSHVVSAVSRVSFQGSFFAHMKARTPRVSLNQVMFSNNLIYNYANRGMQYYGELVYPQFTNIVGNRFKNGTDGNGDPIHFDNTSQPWGRGAGSLVYVADNTRNGAITSNPQYQSSLYTSTPLAEHQGASPIASSTPDGWVPWDNRNNGAAMEAYVLANAGARPSDRTAAMTAAVQSYKSGGGRIIAAADSTTFCPTTGSPGSDVNLAQNSQPFTAVGDPWGNMTDPVDGKTRRKIEVQLLDMAGALQP